MDSMPSPAGFSESQRAGLEVRQADQDRTLVSMHRLEVARSAAAPGREDEWAAEVLAAVVALNEATAEDADNGRSPDSLLADLARTQPWFRQPGAGVLSELPVDARLAHVVQSRARRKHRPGRLRRPTPNAWRRSLPGCATNEFRRPTSSTRPTTTPSTLACPRRRTPWPTTDSHRGPADHSLRKTNMQTAGRPEPKIDR